MTTIQSNGSSRPPGAQHHLPRLFEINQHTKTRFNAPKRRVRAERRLSSLSSSSVQSPNENVCNQNAMRECAQR